MRYSKTHVNEIIDQVLNKANESFIAGFNPVAFDNDIRLIREEHLLVDRRVSSLPEYTADILSDFMKLSLSYKELMAKYHCSFRTLRAVLLEAAEQDQRVYDEIELRRK